MELYVSDTNFITIMEIDVFESVIWTDRYAAYGDFELYTSIDKNLLSIVTQGCYIWVKDSEHVMIVDERVITSDVETGDHLTIKGRSLESILDRRIIWQQTILRGNFQDGIRKLLEENVINPSLIDRKIPNFVFQASNNPEITELKLDTQFTGTNLYEAIRTLCEERQLGFKIILSDDNQLVFSLYKGVDRSYAQDENPYVVFSTDFENLISTNYLESDKKIRNVGLVAGEGEGLDRRIATVGGGSGLDRRELYIDARDISSDTEEGDPPMSDEEYKNLLKSRGEQKLSEYAPVESFEGDVETTQMFVYGTDFFLGDAVQITNEYGIEARSRIVEIIFSNNREGDNVVPTFRVMP